MRIKVPFEFDVEGTKILYNLLNCNEDDIILQNKNTIKISIKKKFVLVIHTSFHTPCLL